MRPQILCIDDDPDVLDGLELVLHSLGEVHVAESGAAALDLSTRLPRLGVVVSDMRMPVRNGAQVLEDFHRLRPDAVRILLTGYTDVGDAIAAINHGRIFRFLTKPCEPALMQRTIVEAVRQHQLICAERELLEQTLKGCLDAMTDALALASPDVFGHAQRVRSLCAEVARRSGVGSHWSLEIAAMLLHIGLVGLPDEVLGPLLRGEAPEARHREQVKQAFSHAMETLQRIPRLEGVRDIIRLAEPLSGGNLEIPLDRADQTRTWSAILRACRQYVRLESMGFPPPAAIAKLRSEGPSEDLLTALASAVGSTGQAEQYREVGLAALEAGMVLAKPLLTQNGQLLAPAGYEIRSGFARRLADLRPEMRHARFQVLVRVGPPRAEPDGPDGNDPATD